MNLLQNNQVIIITELSRAISQRYNNISHSCLDLSSQPSKVNDVQA